MPARRANQADRVHGLGSAAGHARCGSGRPAAHDGLADPAELAADVWESDGELETFLANVGRAGVGVVKPADFIAQTVPQVAVGLVPRRHGRACVGWDPVPAVRPVVGARRVD
jgi:hypothetical protein